MMKNYRIYRKVALERLTSPEQLDRVLRITTLHNWVSLSAVFAIFAAAIAWGTLARLPIVIGGTGVIVSAAPAIRAPESAECSSGQDMPPAERGLQRRPELLVFVPAAEAAGIQAGAAVLFRPAIPGWERFELIQAKVVSVAHASFTFHDLAQSLQTPRLARFWEEHGPVLQLRASFVGAGKDQKIALTNQQEMAWAVLAPGTTGEVELIAGTQRPIGLLVSSAKARFGR
jgi:hypothetical protein